MYVHTYNTHTQFICAHTPTLWAHFHSPLYPVYAEVSPVLLRHLCDATAYVQVLPDFGKSSCQILTQLPLLFVTSAARCLVEYQRAVETQSSPLLSH